MVTESSRGRRGQDGGDPGERTDRGQVILIGAVALAFIVLGVVVVFNGVLYTETLSSADTGQTASSADATELEVRQGIACLVSGDDESGIEELLSTEMDDEIESYESVYQNATVHSKPAIVSVSHESGISVSDFHEEGVNVTVTYASNDLSYERELTVTADQCPRRPTVQQFEYDADASNETDGRYAVNWTAHSSESDLSSVTVSLIDSSGEVVNETETFPDDREASDEETLEWDDEVSHFRIVVRNEAGYMATDTEEIP